MQARSTGFSGLSFKLVYEMASVQCPNCSASYLLPADWPYPFATCPYCRVGAPVPRASARPPAAPRDAQSAGFWAAIGALRALAAVACISAGLALAALLLLRAATN
jgi:hypothetical protein